MPLPVADFFAEVKSCENDTCMVYFYDNSVNAADRFWDFGNGTTSLREIDSTLYVKDVMYTVELTVKNADGGEDGKVKKIKI